MASDKLRLFADRRCGGEERLYLAIEPERMQVPRWVRDCVVFISGVRDGVPGGTGLLLAEKLIDGGHLLYVVTAWHVIDGAIRDSIRCPKDQVLHYDQLVDPKAFLRVNVVGGVMEIEVPLSAWVRHPDDAVDVAVAELPAIPGIDQAFFTTAWLATPEVIEKKGIGLGDDLFVVGLFKEFYGKHRNAPIVRVGNIAAMPIEKVDWSLNGERKQMEAYLAEVRSTGGVSGSPVFAVLDPVRLENRDSKLGGDQVLQLWMPEFYLLGLVHGHWDSAEFNPRGINSGIAVVVPIQRVVEVLATGPFPKRREAEAGRAKSLTVLDAKSEPQLVWTVSLDNPQDSGDVLTNDERGRPAPS